MMRFIKRIVCFGLFAGVAWSTSGFSLLGPPKATAPNNWQARGFGGRPAGLGYTLGGDIGGPMLATEAYRWNVPVITYAYDLTFLRYFGTNGVNAVEEAIGILNALPAATAMSPSLSEFPLDAT